MISEELNSVGAALDRLLAELSGEQAELARLCRHNLRAAAEQVEALEGSLCILNAFGIERLTRAMPEGTRTTM